ncbi:MAG: tubulin-like doman-containing protein, partial [Lachnospiraceae bacterium]|nr:tubulin-like doman-containing protein [Lachnospiraceae bacterium]
LGPSDRIAFLAIDADTYSLNDICRSRGEDGYLEAQEVFNLYDAQQRNLLIIKDMLPPHVHAWLNESLPEVQLDDNGAQGVRQIGRLMLLSCGKYIQLRNRLAEMIQTLSHHAPEPCADLEIILVTGVSGGTGGGTVIDVAYLIRILMTELGLEHSFRLSAYLYMPDVLLGIPAISRQPAVRENLMANGYATLKEIDYYMALQDRRGCYMLDLGDSGQFSCEWNIFDSCSIVSAQTDSGGISSKSKTINNLTEYLLDLLTDISHDGGVDGGMQIAKMMSERRNGNVLTSLIQAGPLSDKVHYPKAVYYGYQAVGYSSVRIPLDEITTYCVNVMFRHVHDALANTNSVDEAMVSSVLQAVHLRDVDDFAYFVLSGAPAAPMDEPIMHVHTLPDDHFPTGRECREGSDTVFRDAQFLAAQEARKITDARFKQVLKAELLNQLNENLNRIFETSGPYVVVELLTRKMNISMTDSDPKKPFSGIVERLEGLQHELYHLAQQCQNARTREVIENMNCLREEAGRFLPDRRKISDYVEYCCRVAWKEVYMSSLYKTLAEILGDVLRELVDANNTVWLAYTDVLDEVGRILERDAAYVMDPRHHTSDVSIINLYEGNTKTQRLRSFLDSLVSPDVTAHLCNELLFSMKNDWRAWTDARDYFEAQIKIGTIFHDSIQGILDRDVVQKLLTAAYSPQNLTIADINGIWEWNDPQKEQALHAAAWEIYVLLEHGQEEFARLSPDYDVRYFIHAGCISFLKDTPVLDENIAEYLSQTVIRAKNAGTNKWVSVCGTFGVPLYTIAGMKDCYEAYRRMLRHARRGLHIDEVTADWSRFPEPYPVDQVAGDGDAYEEFTDYMVLEEIRRDADLAINTYGFIRKQEWRQFSQPQVYVLYSIIGKPEDLSAFRQLIKDSQSTGSSADFVDLVLCEDSGFQIRYEPLLLETFLLDPLDLEGEGRRVPIGVFYKMIRVSVYYMDLLKKNLSLWQEAYEVYQEECYKM